MVSELPTFEVRADETPLTVYHLTLFNRSRFTIDTKEPSRAISSYRTQVDGRLQTEHASGFTLNEKPSVTRRVSFQLECTCSRIGSYRSVSRILLVFRFRQKALPSCVFGATADGYSRAVSVSRTQISLDITSIS